ncbi:MAG: ATP-binding protein [Pseudomonadota bacterium]
MQPLSLNSGDASNSFLLGLTFVFAASTVGLGLALALRERPRFTRRGNTESSALLETALSSGRCGLWSWDVDDRRMYWSASLFELLGRPGVHRSMRMSEVAALIHPYDLAVIRAMESEVAEGQPGIDQALRLKHANGDWIWVRARAEVVNDASGRHLVGIAMDITDQQSIKAASKEAEIRLRDAIEAISEAFVIWDNENRLVLCNQKYREFHGLEKTDCVRGMPYAGLIEKAEQPAVVDIANSDVPGPLERAMDVRFDDGRWLRINERRTRDGGYVSVGTDITALKQHEGDLLETERELTATIADLTQSRTELQRQAQELVRLAKQYHHEKSRAEDASRSKSEFLANMSHELRTPLNAIIAYTEFMQHDSFEMFGRDKFLEYSSDIHHSGLYLLKMIDNILDMAKLEDGKIEIDHDLIDGNKIIGEILRDLDLERPDHQLTILREISNDLTVMADKRALRQVLMNVLSNAVKFTPAGGRVTVRSRQDEHYSHIIIEDTGIGIPEFALSRIGRPFEHVLQAETNAHAGAGLGLAISTSLIAAHDGALTVQSEEGVGTVVSITLPSPRTDEAMESDPNPVTEIEALLERSFSSPLAKSMSTKPQRIV